MSPLVRVIPPICLPLHAPGLASIRVAFSETEEKTLNLFTYIIPLNYYYSINFKIAMMLGCRRKYLHMELRPEAEFMIVNFH